MGKVVLDDLLMAIETVASGEQCGTEILAYVCSQTGKVWTAGDEDYNEEPLPDDLGSNPQYLMAPDKRDLPLGRNVALDFVKAYMPHEVERVYGFFRRKGAYANYKNLLAEQDLLESWYEYEELQTMTCLQQWCEVNDLGVSVPES